MIFGIFGSGDGGWCHFVGVYHIPVLLPYAYSVSLLLPFRLCCDVCDPIILERLTLWGCWVSSHCFFLTFSYAMIIG